MHQSPRLYVIPEHKEEEIKVIEWDEEEQEDERRQQEVTNKDWVGWQEKVFYVENHRQEKGKPCVPARVQAANERWNVFYGDVSPSEGPVPPRITFNETVMQASVSQDEDSVNARGCNYWQWIRVHRQLFERRIHITGEVLKPVLLHQFQLQQRLTVAASSAVPF